MKSCPNCNHDNPNQSFHCQICGFPLKKIMYNSSPEIKDEIVNDIRTNLSSPKCPNCHFIITDDIDFCQNCGSPVNQKIILPPIDLPKKKTKKKSSFDPKQIPKAIYQSSFIQIPVLLKRKFFKHYKAILIVSVIFLAFAWYDHTNYENTHYILRDSLKKELVYYCGSNRNVGKEYNPSIKGIHKIAVLPRSDDLESKLSTVLKKSWEPSSLGEIELATCFAKRESTLFTCNYINIFGKTQLVYFTKYDMSYYVYKSSSHQLLFNQTFVGHNYYKSCPDHINIPSDGIMPGFDPMNYTIFFNNLKNFVEIS